ncbi:pilus assembly PilX family protein [Candidatus Thiodiazotropha sp. CDECU1]|uniref:pilus assembly PilX family protein n=1 Tax=Candidatus Thiodiazotropha sp. CDECU1 TaxID=3065865 RepID=UPI00292CC82B|nr:PilX N-terminal domain-containing pilus assembly protein [Candidatus Thiodiazotropha sp. CDECU1]
MPQSTSISKQSGVALVVSLIVLTIVTLLSISAVQNTNLDTKIAVNHQFKALSFAAAENALAKVIGPDLTVIDDFDIPSQVNEVSEHDSFFVSPEPGDEHSDPLLNAHPPLRASLSMMYQGEREGLFFSGHQLDNTTHLFLTDAIGTVGEGHTHTHNRMQVGLLRQRY